MHDIVGPTSLLVALAAAIAASCAVVADAARLRGRGPAAVPPRSPPPSAPRAVATVARIALCARAVAPLTPPERR